MAMDIHPWLGMRNPVSAATHFFGLLAACIATASFWRLSHQTLYKRVVLACFGLSMMAVYAASSLYHAASPTYSQLQLLRRLDHTAIYLLIAATYTPVLTVPLGKHLRWRAMAGLLWLVAALGITCKWVLPFQPYYLTMGLYLGMGWLGLLPLAAILRASGWHGLSFAVGGGVVYTLGALADLNGWPILIPGVIGSHEVMHVCTMAGSGCHVIYMYRWVIPHAASPLGILPGTEADQAKSTAQLAVTLSPDRRQRPRHVG
jgi:hemolysin III